MSLTLKKLDLKFLTEENGKPCHKHILNGQEVPGCSSIAKMFDDGEWRCGWAAKMMEERINENLPTILKSAILTNTVESQIRSLVTSAKSAWRERRDKTGTSGTTMHKHLEAYIKERMLGRVPAECAPTLIANAGKEFALATIQFLNWEKEGNIEWLASEIQVASETHQYAGIADCVYRQNGQIYLDDFKTADKEKKEWLPQLVGLRHAMHEMGQTIDHIGVLQIQRDGPFVRIPYTYDHRLEFEAFLVAKQFYSQLCLFQKRHRKNKEYYRKAA